MLEARIAGGLCELPQRHIAPAQRFLRGFAGCNVLLQRFVQSGQRLGALHNALLQRVAVPGERLLCLFALPDLAAQCLVGFGEAPVRSGNVDRRYAHQYDDGGAAAQPGRERAQRASQ